MKVNLDKYLRAEIKQLKIQYQFEFKKEVEVFDWLDICDARDKEYIEKNLRMYLLQTLFSIRFDRWISMIDLGCALSDYLSHKRDIIKIPFRHKGKDKYFSFRCKWKDRRIK